MAFAPLEAPSVTRALIACAGESIDFADASASYLLEAKVNGALRGAPIEGDATPLLSQAAKIIQAMTGLRIGELVPPFGRIVLPAKVWQSQSALDNAVERFQTLCMLDYGSFRAGFQELALKPSNRLESRWQDVFGHLESPNLVRGRAAIYVKRPPLVIEKIDGFRLWTLGYLAASEAERINAAKRRLRRVLESLLESGVQDYKALKQWYRRQGEAEKLSFEVLCNRANVDLKPLRENRDDRFRRAVQQAIERCQEINPTEIRRTQEIGRANTSVYSTTREIDVYVATSMRQLNDFATQASLVARIFDEGPLAALNVRYFDPTQAFSHDRIDKGLLECLMIMRSKIVLYNAQEVDTFGKDSEVAYGLSMGRDAVMYIARLLPDHPTLEPLYSWLDRNRGARRDALVKAAADSRIWHGNVEDLKRYETEAEVIGAITEDFSTRLLLPEDLMLSELESHGYTYDEFSHGTLAEYFSQRLRQLEKRAFSFSEAHPLSLQASPFDGVSRGVIVTRTVDQSREVIEDSLLSKREYLVDDKTSKYCVLLREKRTLSPVRVVTRDAVLTAEFWETFQHMHAKLATEPGFAPPPPPEM